MSLISVEEALRRVLASIEAPLDAEIVPLAEAAGRTLAADVAALRTQPPFAASAMDGYAVRAEDVAAVPARLRVIGTSVAGRRFAGLLSAGEAVRIFTGAPLPEGADAIVIQEDATADGGAVVIREPALRGRFVRPSGLDFVHGAVLLRSGDRLDPRRLALAAAMGHADLPVRRKPRVGILATGDELVRPGEPAGPDQIVASNPYALAALVVRAGGDAIDLGIAGDSFAALESSLAEARAQGIDLLVTLGGASVGEHDLVQSALAAEGMALGFWRVALRPGKPLMHGRLGAMTVLGLPGNPVSSIVCGLLFVMPAVRALLGDPQAGAPELEPARLTRDLAANDGRQDYLRAELELVPGDLPRAMPFAKQDSSMLGTLARADALVVRAPHEPAARAGDLCRVIRLDRLA